MGAKKPQPIQDYLSVDLLEQRQVRITVNWTDLAYLARISTLLTDSSKLTLASIVMSSLEALMTLCNDASQHSPETLAALARPDEYDSIRILHQSCLLDIAHRRHQADATRLLLAETLDDLGLSGDALRQHAGTQRSKSQLRSLSADALLDELRTGTTQLDGSLVPMLNEEKLKNPPHPIDTPPK